MAKLDIETVILAHKFTCPYYSPESESKGLLVPSHCGATNAFNQKECTGECWYMSHFKDLLKGLSKKAASEVPCNK